MSQSRPEIVVTDDELTALLQAAAADESFGRMIRCSGEQGISNLSTGCVAKVRELSR